MISVKCNQKEYDSAIGRFHLDPQEMRDEMEENVSFQHFFDDDYSWDQLFSKRAEMDPQSEMDTRATSVARQTEGEGRRLAKEAVKSLASLVETYSRKREYGYDFLRHLLTDCYVPLVKKAQEEWISDAASFKEQVTDQSLRLSILMDKVKTAPLLGGNRESLTLDFLEGADDYLTAVMHLRICENMIRVMSTILSYCSRMMPDEADLILGRKKEPEKESRSTAKNTENVQHQASDSEAPVRNISRTAEKNAVRSGTVKKGTLSFPRRLTVTSDDGREYTVEASDGVHRFFQSGLNEDEALSAVQEWMK